MDITKYLTDTAVLWAKSGKTAYNELTFTAGAEISVRWEDRQEIFISSTGKELISDAIVFVDQDITPDSFLYLGELDDLSAEEKANPKLEQNAYAVRRFEKIKNVGGRIVLRRVHLTGG